MAAEPSTAPPRWQRSGWLLPVLIAVAAGVLYRDFRPDDAFIVLAFARAALDGHPGALVAGEPANAVTSPGWWAVAVICEVIAGKPRPDLAFALLRAASLLCAACALRAAGRAGDRLRDGAGPLVMVAVGLDPWFLRWAASGLETAAAVALTMQAAAWSLDSRTRSRAPWLLVAGAAIRPELVLLAGAFALWAPRPRVRDVVIALIPPVLALAISASWLGAWLPTTAAAKRGFLPTGTAATWAALAIATSQPAGLLAALAARSRWILPALVLASFYVVQGYAPLTRYLLPATALLALPLAALEGRLRGMAFFGTAAASFAVTLLRALPGSHDDNVEAYAQIAQQVGDERVATWEIGRLAREGVAIVDLGGLVTPTRLRHLRGDPPALLAEARPRYSLLRYPIPGATFTEVAGYPIRVPDARGGPREDRVVLWSIEWAPTPTGGSAGPIDPPPSPGPRSTR